MQLYVNRNRPFQQYNQQEFRKIMADYPELEFFHPDWEKAPWHVQCLPDEGIVLNFWPHTAKAQQEYCPAVEGWDNIRALLDELTSPEPDFDVLEY